MLLDNKPTLNRELIHLHHHHALIVEVHRLAIETVANAKENTSHAETLRSRVVRNAEGVVEWNVLQMREANEDVATGKEIHAAETLGQQKFQKYFCNHSPTRQINIRLLPERVQDVWSRLRCRFLHLNRVDNDARESQLLGSVRIQFRFVQLENVVDISVNSVEDRITHGSC